VRFRRLGLSQAINHLLGTLDNPIPFDFLINDIFLRTSLDKFIQKYKLKEENAILIEYVLALGEPDTTNSLQHDDWISALDNHQKLYDTIITSGSYDSLIRLWKSNSLLDVPLFALEGHTGHITSLSSYKSAEDKLCLASASQDQTLRIWNINLTIPSIKGHCTRALIGHTDSVTSCDMNPDLNIVVSGSWDLTVKLWDLKVEELDTDAVAVATTSTKKRKVKVLNQKPQISLTGHKQVVTTVEWISNQEVVSGSWDFNICFWDILSGINTDTKHGNKPITDLSYSPETGILLSAHTDNIIRLWDKRINNIETNSFFSSHRLWVSSVQFHPSKPNYFISGSYDRTVKIWDTRSTTPLYTIPAHNEKILTLTWLNDNEFLTGGADSILKTYTLRT